MIEKIDNATVEQLRKWWRNLPDDIIHAESAEVVLDEIADSLMKKDSDWIPFLEQYAYSDDVNRRASAVFFLSNKSNRTSNLKQILRDAFFSGLPRLQFVALPAAIDSSIFPFSKNDIAPLQDSSDQRLAAWAMAYLCYAFPDERTSILKSALRSQNPRMREYACDVIGNERIQDLKNEMEILLNDADPAVAESARYNFYEMLS